MPTWKEFADGIRQYADETHKHAGIPGGECRADWGDRCDLTAALRAIAARMEMQGEGEDG